MRRRRPGWQRALLALLALLLMLMMAIWLALRASLPGLEGEQALAGLSASIVVERDMLGVATIQGQSRQDVARATGYVHAQDRYFQMDLTRRAAAGELSALLGAGLLDADRSLRRHQFRARARQAMTQLPEHERELLQAYTEGVNAGLADLQLRPFEYLVLQQTPVAWRVEDVLLVVYAMWLDLQGGDAREEQQRGRLAAQLPLPLYRLVTDFDPAFEAALDGSHSLAAPLPTADEADLRQLDPQMFLPAKTTAVQVPQGTRLAAADLVLAPGSNNWALAGARTASGRALIANDMHLGLRVPGTWYRLRLRVPSAGLDVTGVSLPGTPAIIAGSNGKVAWGYTNSYGDFQDLVALTAVPGQAESYLDADGPQPIASEAEVIEVAGADAETLIVRKTRFGPVIADDGEGRELALAWTAHRPEAINMGLLAMETAGDAGEAADIAAAAGMPAQNVMIGDAAGRIAWVLSGRLPRRNAADSTRPLDSASPAPHWPGWIEPADAPRMMDPQVGQAWSANARVVGGQALTLVGDGGYAASARSLQIRDRLAAITAGKPADMLALQLDDRADYLAHWHPLMLEALAALDHPASVEAQALVAGWSGRAAVDDAGYRLLRQFERDVSNSAFAMLTAPARSRWPDFRWRTPARFTETAWRLLQERPAHLLDPNFSSWEDWLADVARQTLDKLPEGCTAINDCRWGQVNTAKIRHPLSQALPLVGAWLDMPADKLPGDWSTPRVQSPGFGASERFAVSPGLESEGYFHMPAGQSGHPLSPFYSAGHAAWVNGEPTPFLPGPAVHRLTLVPSAQ